MLEGGRAVRFAEWTVCFPLVLCFSSTLAGVAVVYHNVTSGSHTTLPFCL